MTANAGTIGPAVAISGQYLKSLSFQSPRRPGFVAIIDEPATYSFDIDVDATSIGPQSYEVTVMMTAEMRHGDEPRIILNMVYGGIFVLSGLPANEIEPTLHIVAPELLFPLMQRKLSRLLLTNGITDRVGSFDFVDLYHRRQGANRPRPV